MSKTILLSQLIIFIFSITTNAQIDAKVDCEILNDWTEFSMTKDSNEIFPFGGKKFKCNKNEYSIRDDGDIIVLTFYEFSIKEEDSLFFINSINTKLKRGVVEGVENGEKYILKYDNLRAFKTIDYKMDLLFIQYNNSIIFIDMYDSKSKSGSVTLKTLLVGDYFTFTLGKLEFSLRDLMNRAVRGSYKGM